jgi:hypothetical protein
MPAPHLGLQPPEQEELNACSLSPQAIIFVVAAKLRQEQRATMSLKAGPVSQKRLTGVLNPEADQELQSKAIFTHYFLDADGTK